MEAGRAAVGRVEGVLPAMDDHGSDARPPILAFGRKRKAGRRLRSLVVDDLLAGDHSDPAALDEMAIPLADAHRGRCAVDNVGHADMAVAMKNPVEGLILIAAVIRVAVLPSTWSAVASAFASAPLFPRFAGTTTACDFS